MIYRCEFRGKNYNLNWSKTNCSNFTRNLHESWDVNSHSKNSSLLACVTPGLDAANFSPWPELTARSPKVWQLLIYSHYFVQRFNPIRSQLENVLDFWLVNVFMKECELIKAGHSFGLLAVTSSMNWLHCSLARFGVLMKLGRCANRERALLSMCYMLLGYSFKLRPYSRRHVTLGSALAIAL